MAPVLFEVGDVVAAVKDAGGHVAPNTVKMDALAGLLPVAATTPRNVRLFDPTKVDQYVEKRAVRRRVKRSA